MQRQPVLSLSNAAQRNINYRLQKTPIFESAVLNIINMMTASKLSSTDYKHLWAKSSPRHPLWKHLLDTAAVSRALSPSGIGFGWEADATAFIVGLHDIGKADACFQHQIPVFSDELVKAGYSVTADARCRHERISARFIKVVPTRVGVNRRKNEGQMCI